MEYMRTALFDLDGVIVDTEPIYDLFWDDASLRYHTGIDHFAQVIKGTTLPDIIANYFSGHPAEEVSRLEAEALAYEACMPLPAMPGSMEFLHVLKEGGVRLGLVTSSDLSKVERAFALHRLDGMFDTVVTADRLTAGKPDPMCYLLAASDLKVAPSECIAFEDSFNGIRAASSAGMRVIGLSTTNPAEALAGKVYRVIPDFREISLAHYLEWCL
jgi:HAD superfamily hydrolase (TIGR01509 family)